MSTRPRSFRVSKAVAKVNLVGANRRRTTTVIRTQAGGRIDKATFERFKNDVMYNRGHMVDVYLQQLCHFINESRGLVAPNRDMLVQPQAFYHSILAPGGEAQGSQQLRADGITAAEFARLEYFFIPMEFNAHTSLVAVSPLRHTVEHLDSVLQTPRTISRIFHVINRFLIHELGALHAPTWRFMHGQAPPQPGAAGCGIFTCLYAKRLALDHALFPLANMGQGIMTTAGAGAGTPDDIHALKLLLLDDLLLPAWRPANMPRGPAHNSSAARLFAPGNPSEPQHDLFLPHAPGEVVDLRRLRSRTGRFDALSVGGLMAYCRAQPVLLMPNGTPRRSPFTGAPMRAMDGWRAWAFWGLPRFIERVEWRWADLAGGRFP